MKIVHVLSTLELGGMETMALALAKFQQSQGHEVSVVAVYGKHELFATAHEMGLMPATLMKRPGKDFLTSIKKLRALFAIRRPDVVHTHNLVTHYLSAAACVLQNDRLLLNTRHDMGEHISSVRGDWLYRAAMKRSAFGVAVCEAARRAFVDRSIISSQKSRTIVNGIDLSIFRKRNEASKKSLLHSLGISGIPVVFGNVGRVNPVKDHETMLLAFADQINAGLNAVLVIAGDGPNLNNVRALIASNSLERNVFLLGRRSDVSELLQSFDVFLQSSITEGYSLALVEAASTALPILATNVGGNSEIIENGVNGYLVPSKDVRAYSLALKQLAESESIREKLGENALKWSSENGSISVMYERYLRLYKGDRT
jgi:glycosyltransferase involved in cell wall biosynthesis